MVSPAESPWESPVSVLSVWTPSGESGSRILGSGGVSSPVRGSLSIASSSSS